MSPVEVFTDFELVITQAIELAIPIMEPFKLGVDEMGVGEVATILFSPFQCLPPSPPPYISLAPLTSSSWTFSLSPPSSLLPLLFLPLPISLSPPHLSLSSRSLLILFSSLTFHASYSSS